MPPDVRWRVLKALRVAVQRGYGYTMAWRMLREDGVDVSRKAVEYWYYKLFPDRVKRRGEYLPRDLRIEIYHRVLELRGQGLGHRRIGRMVEEIYGIRLNPATICHWCRGIHNPLNGCRIPSIKFLKPSPELSYVIGVVAGDGTACKNSRKSGQYVISVKAKDVEFVEEFARCLGKVLGRDPPRPMPRKDGSFMVRVYSRALYDMLRKPIDVERIKPFVEHSEECIRSFLRGFFDSEGSVSRGGEILQCANTDIRLIEYVQRLLHGLGVETTAYVRKEKGTPLYNRDMGRTYVRKGDVYILYVRARSRLKFYQLIGFTIRRKQQRLEERLKKRGLVEDGEAPPNKPSPPSFCFTPAT